jgi:hypothetical protein
MKKFRLYIISAVVLSLAYGCADDVLTKYPLDMISDQTVWNDPVLIEQYLTQCYAEVGPYFDQGYRFDNTKDVLQELVMLAIADEATYGWQQTPKSHQITVTGSHEYSFTGTGQASLMWWGYPTVRRLNQFLERVGEALVSDRERLIGEARFLRAFCYFNMVKRYGGVPLILREQLLDDPEEELYRKRDREEDVYQFIIDEMDDLVTNGILPSSAPAGRVTLYTALALKSRAAMYAASIATWGTVQLDGVVGIPSGKAAYFWQASYDASKKIISDGQFALYLAKPDDRAANYRELFLTKNNSEVIWAECYTGVSGKNHSWDLCNSPFSYNPWAGGQQNPVYLEMVESYGHIDGTDGVIDRDKINASHLWTMDELFGKKDPRFKASVFTHETPWIGDLLDYHYGVITEDGTLTTEPYKEVLGSGRCNGRSTPFGILKYLDESIAIPSGPRTSATDWIVFRLGEIYLNLAEAAFELGKADEAKDAVNEIRRRAGMPEFTSVTREEIRAERKVELAFEANRYWDVRRWRTAVTDLTKSYSGLRYILDYQTRKYKLEIVPDVNGFPSPYFEEKHYYFPMTLGRISNNPNLVENPGW